MSEKEITKMSAFDIFNAHQETIDDAKKKNAEESGGKRFEMFRMDKEGKYKIRILPNAPINVNNTWQLPRPGYEYPAKELLLKIESGKTDDGKPKFQYVNVRHLKHVYPQLNQDLIDLFVDIACEKYASDQALVKSIRENNFSGGLKYDHKRYMFVIDLDDRAKGIQMLSLSFSQYKELEERKLDVWNEECSDNEHAPCPISSPEDAYPVEITRKKENKKVSYTFNVNTRKKVPLTEEELNKLLETPRLNEQLYRYSRFHLEATLAFLKQYEEKKDIDVLSDSRITDLVEKIKTLLPSEDTSHFNINGKPDAHSEDTAASKTTIDDLWSVYNQLQDNDLDDKSAEGQNLRNAIVEFINDNDLDVAYSRRITNGELLERIDEAMGIPSDDAQDAAGEDMENDPEPETDHEPENDPEDEEDDAPASTPSRSRNDDTNEPAAQLDRRANRPIRRRR